MYQNGENGKNYHTIFKNVYLIQYINGHKVYQMVINDVKNLNSKAFQNVTKFEGLV
jgi:hypothetical protein